MDSPHLPSYRPRSHPYLRPRRLAAPPSRPVSHPAWDSSRTDLTALRLSEPERVQRALSAMASSHLSQDTLMRKLAAALQLDGGKEVVCEWRRGEGAPR